MTEYFSQDFFFPDTDCSPMIFSRFDAKFMATLFGGEVAGLTSVIVPGPNRGKNDRSLLIKEDLNAEGGFIVHSSSDDPQICREYVVETVERCTHRPTPSEGWGSAMSDPSTRANVPTLRAAMEVWSETTSAEGTLVEYYLKNRGLRLPAESAPFILNDSVRFHPAYPFRPNETFPCLVGLYRHVTTDMPTGILLTALSEKGDKIGRKVLGPAIYSAIKLRRSYISDRSLALAESLESALAGISQVGCPVWCVGGAEHMRRFDVLEGVDKLIILADGAEDSITFSNAKECLYRWKYSDAELHHVVPNYVGSQ